MMIDSADPSGLAEALAYALRYRSGKRVHNADEIMAKRLVEYFIQQRILRQKKMLA